MELADVTDSKSVGATRAGSSPATGTNQSSFLTALFFFANCLKWRSFAVFGSFYFCLENVRKRKNQSGCTPVAPEKIKNSGLMRFFGYRFRSPAP